MTDPRPPKRQKLIDLAKDEDSPSASPLKKAKTEDSHGQNVSGVAEGQRHDIRAAEREQLEEAAIRTEIRKIELEQQKLDLQLQLKRLQRTGD